MCSHVKEVAVAVRVLGGVEERNQKICFEAGTLCDLPGRKMLCVSLEKGTVIPIIIILLRCKNKICGWLRQEPSRFNLKKLTCIKWIKQPDKKKKNACTPPKVLNGPTHKRRQRRKGSLAPDLITAPHRREVLKEVGQQKGQLS